MTPSRYVSIEEEEEFEAKMRYLTSELAEEMNEGKKLDEEIISNLRIGF